MMRQRVMILVIMSASLAYAADLLLYDGFNYSTGELFVQNIDKVPEPTSLLLAALTGGVMLCAIGGRRGRFHFKV